MKYLVFILGAILMSHAAATAAEKQKGAPVPPALAFKMKSLQGKEIDLARYHGKVVLVVNVASECGLTGQYAPLQTLHQKHAAAGLAILGFPCNQFGSQEPGNDEQIATFCKQNYGVEFDMFAKVDVNGEGAAPFFKHLKTQATQPKGPGEIGWNFEKFLLDRQGKVIARFDPETSPDSSEIVTAIEKALQAK